MVLKHQIVFFLNIFEIKNLHLVVESTTYLTITNANAIDTIEIYNSIGQSVLHLNNLNTTFNIDITNLSNGLYTIKLNSNDRQKISRFIKQ